MTPLRYLLLGDGSSDECLLPIIAYALRRSPALVGRDLASDFARPGDADVGKASIGLDARVRNVLASRPCDLLFVHRDAEGASLEDRQREIATSCQPGGPPHVPVVPVRMSEAWLLIDPAVIRRAADNPSGRVRLNLPQLKTLERLADPKQKLTDLLLAASEKTGRQLAKFQEKGQMSQRRRRVAMLIQDFSPLDSLPAFHAFLDETRRAVEQLDL